jgi:hypothetical protein
VQDQFIFDYAVIRVVPKVEREEFINVGVILSCHDKDFLEADFHINEEKLKALDPDIDLETVKSHLNAIKEICAGGIGAGGLGKLSKRERFHWLTSPRSTIIQTSPVHSGYCKDPAEKLKQLLEQLVIVKKSNHQST